MKLTPAKIQFACRYASVATWYCWRISYLAQDMETVATGYPA